MSNEEERKRRAIQNELAVYAARARLEGADERTYVDDKGRVRLVEHIGKKRVVKTYVTEEGTISQVRITSVRDELREINQQWDEMAPRIASEMLEKLFARMNSADSTPREQTAVRLALGHIWRRRKDLRAEISRAVPDIKRFLKVGRG